MIKKTLLAVATTAVACIIVTAPTQVEAHRGGHDGGKRISVNQNSGVKKAKKKQSDQRNRYNRFQASLSNIQSDREVDTVINMLDMETSADEEYVTEEQESALRNEARRRKGNRHNAASNNITTNTNSSSVTSTDNVLVNTSTEDSGVLTCAGLASQTWSIGQTGSDVTDLQECLIQSGDFTHSVGATGYYGSITQAALASYNGLSNTSEASSTYTSGVSGNCDSYRPLVEQYDWNVDTMMYAMYAESGCNPNAVGDQYVIAGVYAPSCGLLQVRTLAGRPSCSELQDPVTNVSTSYQIWLSQGYNAWTTLH